jgi:acyl-CoA reductase-like NAD-dependent aldehyde dehydrogenase
MPRGSGPAGPAPRSGPVLRRIADGIRADREELARLILGEQGKTITELCVEVGDAAADFFDYCALYERARVSAMFASDATNEHPIGRKVPCEVVVGIIPWNYPAPFARKVAPTIMAGNAIVLQPHEDAPLSALALVSR